MKAKSVQTLLAFIIIGALANSLIDIIFILSHCSFSHYSAPPAGLISE